MRCDIEADASGKAWRSSAPRTLALPASLGVFLRATFQSSNPLEAATHSPSHAPGASFPASEQNHSLLPSLSSKAPTQ
jgi:hypothetical protein